MAKGLSNIQKTIIEVLKENNGCKYYELTALVKIRLYPELWFKSNYSIFPYFRYGERSKEKNKARATISRSIKRLKERNLIIEGENYRYYLNG